MTMECRVAVESNDLYNGMSVEYQMKQEWFANKVKSKVNLFRDSRSNYPVYHYHAQSSFYLSNRLCKRLISVRVSTLALRLSGKEARYMWELQPRQLLGLVCPIRPNRFSFSSSTERVPYYNDFQFATERHPRNE